MSTKVKIPGNYLNKSSQSTGVQGVTGAAPQTVAGGTIPSQFVGDALGARVYVKATTTSLTLTAHWQVLDDDGATWQYVIESQNPTVAALITGTGTAATAVYFVSAPPCVQGGGRSARLVVISGAASGGGAGTDECSIAYDYRAPIVAYGP